MSDTDWKTWRLESGGFTWRVALPEDAPELEAHMQVMDKRLGEQNRPPFFDAPTLITLVAEDKDGVIQGGVYLARIVEVAFIGMNKRVFQSTEALMPTLVGFARERKFRLGQVLVPNILRRLLQPLYERVGFRRTTEQFTHFGMRVPHD